MKWMKNRKKKGISSIVGTIMIVAITLVMGGLLYAYSQGLFGSMTQTANVQVNIRIIVNPSTGKAYLFYSFSNQGNIGLNITSINIIELGNNSLLTSPIQLLPGQSVQGYSIINQIVVAGKQYTVTINGKYYNNQPYSQVLNVLASTT
jgi:flagellin-like protein